MNFNLQTFIRLNMIEIFGITYILVILLNSFDFVVNRYFVKLFRTCYINIVRYCQFSLLIGLVCLKIVL